MYDAYMLYIRVDKGLQWSWKQENGRIDLRFQKFQISGIFLTLSVRFCSTMLEAELALAQNMKVVENGILQVPIKFQLNRSNVICEKTKIPLLVQVTFQSSAWTVQSLWLCLFTIIRSVLANCQNIKVLVPCLSFPTPTRTS